MSVTCAVLAQPDLMKPLPELPPPSPTVRIVSGAVAKPYPLPYRSTSTSRISQHATILSLSTHEVQRSHTLQANPVNGFQLDCPFEPDCIDVDLSDLVLLSPEPLKIEKPQPPAYHAPDSARSHNKVSHEITYPRVPRRSATDSYLLTSHNPHLFAGTPGSQPRRTPRHNHQFDYLPTIETRLDAWIHENQHHAEPSPDQDMHELRCDKCRFGVGLIDVQNPSVTGKPDGQWCSPKQRQAQRSTLMRMRSCTVPVTKSAVMGSLITVREVDECGSGSETGSEREEVMERVMVKEMQDRRSIWDKPSFRGFLVKVGGLKVR